jgi:hypothetical protein
MLRMPLLRNVVLIGIARIARRNPGIMSSGTRPTMTTGSPLTLSLMIVGAYGLSSIGKLAGTSLPRNLLASCGIITRSAAISCHPVTVPPP